jgi:hypothetical protein
MEPFQLLYMTESTDSKAIDTIALLEATHQHIDALLEPSEDYVRVSLFQTMQSDQESMYVNGTKAGFSGTIYYSKPKHLAKHHQSTPQEDHLLCFLGANKTKYVSSLHDAGWTALQDIALLTLGGSVVPDPEATKNSNGFFIGMCFAIAIVVPLVAFVAFNTDVVWNRARALGHGGGRANEKITMAENSDEEGNPVYDASTGDGYGSDEERLKEELPGVMEPNQLI